MAKPTVPQGTRDFGPEVVRKRQYILNTIKTVFELYGFQPLETPAMENLETLMGKYGEEGDKLIFRILDSGNPFTEDFFRGFLDYLKDWDDEVDKNARKQGLYIGGPLSKINILDINPPILSSLAKDLIENEDLNKKYLPKFKSNLAKRALRYDLTIPFARYVAMNHGQLTLPFKRYQIQPVWRADRPQRGRYREFYQCDADVVGSKSLLNEVELTLLYTEVFTRLKMDGFELRINSRKILSALAEVCGGAGKMADITIAIDKLDKIGIEKVKEELTQRGLTEQQVNIIEKYLFIEGSNEQKLQQIESLLANNDQGKKGIEEIKYILKHTINHQPSTVNLIVDFTLARGLNYYTGIIFEVKAPPSVKIGSIGGGGRYDDLTGLFGVPNMPGVGISFGVDRIYDVLEELNLFPDTVVQGTKVLFFNLGEKESEAAFSLVQQLRGKGISAEIFHEAARMDKQFKWAEKKGILYAVIIGSKELESGTCNLKNLVSGTQQTMPMHELLQQPFN